MAEEPGRFAKGDFPADIRVRPRSELALAEQRLREEPGVSAIIYDQVCAAEKRRRRKRGLMPPAPARVLINESVCEGCGDCGQQSNCVGAGEASVLLGCDLLGAAGGDNLRLLADGAIGVVNTAEVMPGEFTRQPDLAFPAGTARARIDRAIQAERLLAIDAMALAERLVGDAVGANMLVLGAAWQRGGVPASEMAIRRAIELNGVAVKMNLAAFAWGRAIAHDPALAQAEVPPLRQSAAGTLARSSRCVALISKPMAGRGSPPAMTGWWRRQRSAKRPCFLTPLPSLVPSRRAITSFSPTGRVRGRPPTLGCRVPGWDADPFRRGCAHRLPSRAAAPARPGCRHGPTSQAALRPLVAPVLKVVAALRPLRGTSFDPFGYTAERKAERAAIPAYEAAVEELMGALSQENAAIIADILRLPLQIRGFGPVKDAARARAIVREKELRQRLIHARAPVAIP